MPSAGIRLLAMGRTASRYGERLVTHEATLAVLAALREKLFLGWAQPGAARQLQLRPARLLQRLTADVDALDSLYLRLMVPVAAAAGAVLLAAIVLGALTWWLGVAVLLGLCVAGGGLAWWLLQRSHVPALRRAVALERLRAQAVDVVAGQTELLMAGQLPRACEQLMQADARVAQADHALNRLDAQAATGFGVAGALVLAGVLAMAGWLVQAGVIGAPGAALALLVALTAMEPLPHCAVAHWKLGARGWLRVDWASACRSRSVMHPAGSLRRMQTPPLCSIRSRCSTPALPCLRCIKSACALRKAKGWPWWAPAALANLPCWKCWPVSCP